jgi:uncharacterized membrane protein
MASGRFAVDPDTKDPLEKYVAWSPDERIAKYGPKKFMDFCDLLSKLSRLVLQMTRKKCFLDCFDAISEADKAWGSFSKALSEFTFDIEDQIRNWISRKENTRREHSSSMEQWSLNTVFIDLFAYAALGVSFFGIVVIRFMDFFGMLGAATALVLYVVMSGIMVTGILWLVAIRRTLKSKRKNANERALISLEKDEAALKDRLAKIQRKYKQYLRR